MDGGLLAGLVTMPDPDAMRAARIERRLAGTG